MKNEKEFKELVAKSASYIEVINKLGLKPNGTGYGKVQRMIKKMGINVNHFETSPDNIDKFYQKKYPLDDYFSNKKPIHSAELKKRLIRHGIKKNICEKCGLTHWLGVPMSLELHHINKNKKDNSLENLTILCPNCHWVVHHLDKTKNEAKIDRRNRIKPELRKIDRPPYKQLLDDIAKAGYSGAGRKYGVSDNAVRKWIKVYEKYDPTSNKELH